MNIKDFPPIISVTGLDGAGKSTLIRHLMQEIPGSVAVTIWDLLQRPQTRSQLLFKSPADIDAYLGTLDPEGRAYFLLHCYYQALVMAAQQQPELILADGYWYKYLATEMAHGGQTDLLTSLTAPFPEPKLNIYLELSLEDSAQRKQRYSAYECGFSDPPDASSFIEFQAKALTAFNNLIKGRKVYQLNAQSPPESIAKQALLLIKKHL